LQSIEGQSLKALIAMLAARRGLDGHAGQFEAVGHKRAFGFEYPPREAREALLDAEASEGGIIKPQIGAGGGAKFLD
jgi:hypothetical protein